MRGARWLLVFAILAILAGVAATYRSQRAILEKQAPAQPVALPSGLSGKLEDWQWSHTDQGRPVVQIRAADVKQEKDSSQVQLAGVELHIFDKAGDRYDLVRSARAEFDQSRGHLYSDGQVDITLGLPAEGQPERTPVTIRSSGVTFESKTGKAATSRATHFTFENGEGDSQGATYDPATRELRLLSQVRLDWKAPSPGAEPMRLETAELTYREGSSAILLSPWARLKRDQAVIEAAATLVTLEDGAIHQVDAQQAHGVDEYPNRRLQYSAGQLQVLYNDEGQIHKITGMHNARLVSVSDGAQTTMTTDRVDMAFQTVNGDSTLTKVLGTGHTAVESVPLPAQGPDLPETRVLRSEIVEIRMRPGGREIDRVLTHSPGHFELLAAQPTQRHRVVDGDRMDIAYGARNRMQSFLATGAHTLTEPTAGERARKQLPSITRSQGLTAQFDPKTGQMKRLEQWEDFAYEAGDRRAQAARATLESDSDLITLETLARVWDAGSTTSADRIRLDQNTGDFAADGHVTSSRQPDSKGPSSGMLAGDEPIQALAEHMTAAHHNRLLHYEGRAVMWQGSDRLQADRIDLDRDKKTLTAQGHVESRMREKPAGPPDNGAPAPVFTVVKADNLVYTDQDRLAHYTGNVSLTQPSLRVKASALRAFLAESRSAGSKTKDSKESSQSSRLEKALADGKVEIVQTAPDRTRTGTGEHAEYYTGEERILLRGGEPQMVDSARGSTRGVELTYFINDNRLLVSGGPGARASSRLHRK